MNVFEKFIRNLCSSGLRCLTLRSASAQEAQNIRIYSRSSKFEMAPVGYSGPWGNGLVKKKPGAENLVSDSLQIAFYGNVCQKKLKMKDCDLEINMRLSS
jgi:hypothetical protein